jgi:hypothetical protein
MQNNFKSEKPMTFILKKHERNKQRTVTTNIVIVQKNLTITTLKQLLNRNNKIPYATTQKIQVSR